jgi:multisubunit Na+/H+ antiporter MnhB subunit
MKWYTVGITVLCLIGIVAGYLDLKRYRDLAQGLGLFNYWMCLGGTLVGSWISLWALGHMIKAKGIKIPKM